MDKNRSIYAIYKYNFRKCLLLVAKLLRKLENFYVLLSGPLSCQRLLESSHGRGV